MTAVARILTDDDLLAAWHAAIAGVGPTETMQLVAFEWDTRACAPCRMTWHDRNDAAWHATLEALDLNVWQWCAQHYPQTAGMVPITLWTGARTQRRHPAAIVNDLISCARRAMTVARYRP